MPTYAYRCTVCRNELEAKQSFTEEALTVCPECGGSLRKLFSSVGVVFKGSGFYRTDSRTGSSTAAATTATTGPAKTAAAKETVGAGASTAAAPASAPASAST